MFGVYNVRQPSMPQMQLGSLQLLAPRGWKRTPPPSRTSKPLETLSAAVVNTINSRDCEHHPVFDCVSASYISMRDGEVGGFSRDEFINRVKTFTEAHPSLHVALMNSSSHADETAGKATVWLTYKVVNYPDHELHREEIFVFHWARTDGAWICLTMDCARGSGVHP